MRRGGGGPPLFFLSPRKFDVKVKKALGRLPPLSFPPSLKKRGELPTILSFSPSSHRTNGSSNPAPFFSPSFYRVFFFGWAVAPFLFFFFFFSIGVLSPLREMYRLVRVAARREAGLVFPFSLLQFDSLFFFPSGGRRR